MQRIEEIVPTTPGVRHTVAIAGQSILLNANAPNFGAMYVMLDDFHERLSPESVGRRDRRRACKRSCRARSRDGVVNVFGAPPLEGLGTAGGFKIMIEDRGDTGLEALQKRGRQDRGRRRRTRPACATCSPASAPIRPGCISTSTAPRPRRWASRWPRSSTRCKSISARCTSTTSIASAAPGRSTCRPTRTFASRSTTCKQLKVRNQTRADGAVRHDRQVRDVSGPVLIARYNMYPAAPINGSAGPGRSARARRSS